MEAIEVREVRRSASRPGRFWLLLIAPLAVRAQADINLEWRPPNTTAQVGQTVGVGLYAVSDSSQDQYFSAVQVIIAWDIGYLHLAGLDATGGIGLFSSSFPADDAFGLNETVPPADGDGLWVGLAFPGVLPAHPQGSLLTTILFQALAPTPGTAVEMLASGGSPVGYTKVIGTIPNQDVLGTIGGPATVEIVPEPATLALGALAGLTLWRRRNRVAARQ